MMRSAWTVLITGIIAITFMAGCSTSTEPSVQASERLLISSSTENGIRVDVYADQGLHAGYNPVYYKVTRNGVVVTNVHLHVIPMMYMGSHDHGCPSVAPSEEPDSKGMFPAAVIFTMPSDSMWFLNVDVHDHAADSATSLSIRVPVASGNTVNVMKSGTTGTMIVTMLPPTKWREGMNDVTFMLHTTEDGLNFFNVDAAVLTMTPSMPSMGHGSYGNLDPKAIGNGWYQGAVNLIMRGEWAIDLAAKSGEGLDWSTRFMIMVP